MRKDAKINQRQCKYVYLLNGHLKNCIIKHIYTNRGQQNYIQGRSRALWFENPKPEFESSPPPSRRRRTQSDISSTHQYSSAGVENNNISECNQKCCSKKTASLHKDIPITSFLRGIWFNNDVNKHFRTIYHCKTHTEDKTNIKGRAIQHKCCFMVILAKHDTFCPSFGFINHVFTVTHNKSLSSIWKK